MPTQSQPVTIGIIGLGRAGWGMHCKELETRRDRFRIVAGCDIIRERRDQFATTYGARAYRRPEELVRDPEIELVSIATRSPDHVDHALLALTAGKKVFIEKPIAISYAEARRLLKEAGRHKRNLYVRHNRRFEAAFNQILDIMESGLLGEVFEVKLRRLGYSRRDDWQTILRHGGGQLLNWGPHIVDHALQFLASPVASMWSDLKKVAAVGDAEDHLKIVLRGTNGRVVDLEISGGSARGEPVYWMAGSRGALTSDEKTIELRYLDPAVRLPRRRAKAGTPDYGSFGSKEDLPWIVESRPVRKEVGPDSIWDALYATLREGAPFRVTLQESLAVMRILSRARKGTPFESVGDLDGTCAP